MLGGVLGIEKSSGVSVISVVSSEEKKCSSGSAIEEGVSGSCCIIFSSVEGCAGEASVSVGRSSFIWWSESQDSSFSGVVSSDSGGVSSVSGGIPSVSSS